MWRKYVRKPWHSVLELWKLDRGLSHWQWVSKRVLLWEKWHWQTSWSLRVFWHCTLTILILYWWNWSLLPSSQTICLPLLVCGFSCAFWKSSLADKYDYKPGHGHYLPLHWPSLVILQPALAFSSKSYAVTVSNKGAALDNCWGFIDKTERPVWRLGSNQCVLYNGHKRYTL